MTTPTTPAPLRAATEDEFEYSRDEAKRLTTIAEKFASRTEYGEVVFGNHEWMMFVADASTRAPAPVAHRPAELSDKQIEAGWKATFSTENPFCPCTLKTFTKAVQWAERTIAKAQGARNEQR